MNKSQVINQTEFEVIESIVTCTICNGIIQDPVQCTQCENLFCRQCLGLWNKTSTNCPFRCREAKMKESFMARALLAKIYLQCPNECGYKIPFFEYEEHCEALCPLLNYKEKYESLMLKYNELKEEMNQIKGIEIKGKSFQYLSSKHSHHPLCLCFTTVPNWRCIGCMKVYPMTVAMFYCSVCNFELCRKCKEEFA